MPNSKPSLTSDPGERPNQDFKYRWLARYAAAVAAAGGGLLLRLGLTALVGEGLPTYITFYPAVMVVALLGGFWPGLVATVTAALVVDYWLLPPLGRFEITNPVDAVGMAFFCSMGLFISVVAELYRRARLKAAAYDKELALRETRRQNEFLASVIERSSQAFAVGYPDGRLGLINRAFEQLTGYSGEELRSRDWASTLTPPEWREIERQKLEELHATGQPVHYEKEYLRKDGSRVPIELLVHLARDAKGKPEYYYSFLTDISERKQAEKAVYQLNAELRQRVAELQAANQEVQASRQAALSLAEDAIRARQQTEQASADLRSSAEQRRLALEAADLGAWDYHFQTGEVFWDERCRQMWGIPEAEKIDYARAIAAIDPEDRAAVDEAVQQALTGKSGGVYHREFRVIWPDGSVHWIASHGRVYFQGDGDQRRAVRFIGVNLEVTAEKQAQAALLQTAEELERSNRDLEQFAYVASHDLQEPLRAIGGYVKLLQNRFPDKLDAKAQDYIAGACEGATRMEQLITDLLAYSRVGTRGGHFTPADLETVLAQALGNLEAGIKSAQATVTHDPLPALSVDATQVMQLFQNLIGNALKFRSESPPQIHIGVRPEEGRWVLWVRDNGIGIEAEYFGRIFQVFQRLHTRKQYPGTGIGLAVCKKIVERHGGTIWVESQPGHGSTFFFSMPK
ncbi:MAG: PAS domain S-box protein [Verrucomicrobiota bacterium]|jgi:PAS domain S-box-containing protein